MSWSEKSPSGEVGQSFKVFFRCNVTTWDQLDNKLSEISKVDKIDFRFHEKSSLIINNITRYLFWSRDNYDQEAP